MGSLLRDTRTRVLAIGLGTAALILWMSASFWLDAWNQSADARRFERLSAVGNALLGTTRELAEERALTLGVIDVALGGRLVLEDVDSTETVRADLHDVRERVDEGLDALIASIDEVLATPPLVERLRDVPEAMRGMLERLEKERETLDRARSWLDARLAGPVANTARDAPLALLIHDAGRRIVRELQALRNGLHLEPYKAMPLVDSLLRVRTGLQDLVEAERARTTLQGLSWTYELMGSEASRPRTLDDALNGANARSRGAADRLMMIADERRIDDALRRELRSLIESYEGLVSGGLPVAPSIAGLPWRRALALDERIDHLVAGRVTDTKHHGYRRLLVDTVLIAICFWIVFASLRLLDSIRHQATHDRLTSLPNRACFEERLGKALAAERRAGAETALLMIDIDDFKLVNDTFGHAIGDELLRRLGARLSARLDRHDFLAALGGDEFAVALWGTASVERAAEVAEHLRGACDEPFEVDGAALRVTLSIGVSVSGDHASNAPGLLQRASIAMRQAKDAGKDRVHPFSPELAEQSRARIELEAELRRAVADGQLELHYQPKVDTRSGRVLGAEALVRWRHPERGLVSPGLFIPLAEECGLILPIGAWVLEEAVRQSARWRREGLASLQVAVNVSAEQFVGAGFAESVEAVLDRHGLPPGGLELELTESVGMMDMDLVVARLARLRAKGVSIAIDDFGTDYSSLQYLEDLPLDTLKIDRAFVVKLDRPEQGRSLVNTIVLMASSLGLRTVAEGVETRAQLDKVIALGCDQVQGYYHSKPVAADELPDVIARIDAAAHGDDERRAA